MLKKIRSYLRNNTDFSIHLIFEMCIFDERIEFSVRGSREKRSVRISSRLFPSDIVYVRK